MYNVERDIIMIRKSIIPYTKTEILDRLKNWETTDNKTYYKGGSYYTYEITLKEKSYKIKESEHGSHFLDRGSSTYELKYRENNRNIFVGKYYIVSINDNKVNVYLDSVNYSGHGIQGYEVYQELTIDRFLNKRRCRFIYESVLYDLGQENFKKLLKKLLKKLQNE